MPKIIKNKIFIIDDDKFLLDMYARKFEQSGFDVTVCTGSNDALEKIKNIGSPDVIITDILMPQMNGFEFLESIQKNKLAGKTKIIILSNKGEKQDIDRGMELGASGYIIKASTIPSEVVEKVNQIIG